jgi:hypothetical protein
MENTETNDMNTRVITDNPSPRPEGKEQRPLMSRILQVIVLTVVIVGAGLVFAFFSLDATAAPSVRWTPTSVSETLLPGESRTVALTMTAREAVPSATIRVVPELASYVSVSPASIGPLAKGETTSLSLSITAPIDAIPHTATGTVQLRHANEPNRTIAQPIPVSVDVVWPRAEGLPGGVSFSYTTFGTEGLITSTSMDFGLMQGIVHRIQFPTLRATDGATQYLITIIENTAFSSIRDWFIGNVDPDNALLTSGVIEATLLSNGMEALVLRGEVPEGWDRGPVSDVFSMSPSKGTVVIVVTSNGDTMGHDLGVNRETLLSSYLEIINSMTLP